MDERMMVLKMLEEGKITAAEAAKLLEALGTDSASAAGSATQGEAVFVTSGVRDDESWAHVGHVGTDLAERIQQRVLSELERIPDLVEHGLKHPTRFGFGFLAGGHRVDEELKGQWTGEGEVLLDLNGQNGAINLRAWDEPNVRVVLHKWVPGALSGAEVERRAKEMARVTWTERGLAIEQEDTGWFNKGGLGIELWLPGNRTYRCQVRTSNGGVTARELRFAGGEIRTSNGRIELLDCAGKAPALRTSNGKIVAEGVRGSIAAETSNGKVIVRPAEDPFDGEEEVMYTISTSNGRVHVHLPDEATIGYDFDLSTTLGRVRVNLEHVQFAQVKSGRESFIGRTADFEKSSRRIVLRARTSYGTVHVASGTDNDLA